MVTTVAQKIEFNAERCKGCGLCIHHCARDCIVMGDHFNANGYLLPVFDEAKCTSCGICGWLCPDLAITVYK